MEDYTDGIGLEFENWRFNLRQSNTEQVVILNVESRTDIAFMQKNCLVVNLAKVNSHIKKPKTQAIDWDFWF